MRKILFKIAVLGLLISNATPSFSSSDYDDQIKAMFIYNFTNFVKWPEQAFESNSAPLTVCLYGKISFIDQLEIFNGAPVRNRFINVSKLKNEKQLKKGCHILYVGDDEVGAVSKIIESLDHKFILSVADMENFVRKGGMLNILRTSDGKKFRVNLQKVLNQGLRMSSDLLELSEVVE